MGAGRGQLSNAGPWRAAEARRGNWISGLSRLLELARRRALDQGNGSGRVVATDLVLGRRLPRPDVGARRLVEQAGHQLERRLVLQGRQDLERADDGDYLEPAARTFD